MERAINDLLSYARPKPPRLVLANASALVERMIPLVRPQADTGGVDIVTKTDGDHAQIRVDPELMTQALVNLALNGIQAMEPGGTLEIATARINSEVRIAISDSGRGIPEDRLTEIYRPFFTSKHQGTGLGLAITRGIVERHGGRLEVESTVGVGSTFRITLPIDAEQEVA
jgi:signal transduction histidine kinase